MVEVPVEGVKHGQEEGRNLKGEEAASIKMVAEEVSKQINTNPLLSLRIQSREPKWMR